VHDVTLLEYLTFQCRFTIDNGNNDKYGNGDDMGEEFGEVEFHVCILN
jgi:hypothetical protein